MIKANFNTYSTYVTDSLYQWDLNQVLTVNGLNLSVVPEVHFSNANMDKAIVRQSTMKDHVVSVNIPNSLLQDPLTIHAHIGIYEGKTFKVVERVDIPVIPKKRPSDYQVEDADEEVYSFRALENAISNMTTKAEVNVISARIDTIVANANSAEGNSELVDIRIGPDGRLYTSAGESVRLQTERLSDHISDMTISSLNLFDKRRITRGKFLSYDNTGEPYNIEGFFVSDYIPVEPNTLYNITYSASAKMISQYDSTFKHISSIGAWNVTTAENAAYIRFSAEENAIDSIVLAKGTLPAVYEPYFRRINYDIFPTNALDGKVLKNKTASVAKLAEYKITSNNLFNKEAITNSVYLYGADGSLKEFDGYFTTDYISVKPNTVYSSTYIEQVAFYDNNCNFIKKISAVESGFTTPDNAAFIRMSDDIGQLEKMQLNESDILLPYDQFAYTLIGFSETKKPERFCTLGYAWSKWAVNEKFPIGILGDSTTDGASTTGWTSETGHEYQDENVGGFGSVDYINENAYPYKLETLIRNELGNTVMRVYNMGYSGYSFHTIMQHYDAIFGGVYSDVKMVGINMGINDRIANGEEDLYYKNFRDNLIRTIEYLYKKGIQPFIITSQATIEPYPDDSLEYFYPLRTSEAINSIANRVKREVAREYDLEILDMTMYDEFMMTYSNRVITDIISDDLHYKDLGHTLEAEFLFSEIAPRTVKVTDKTRLGFSCQRVKSECPSNKVIYLTQPIEKMKLSVDYEKDNTDDIVIQDYIINITEKESLTLKSYCTSVKSQYVIVDDEVISITETEQIVKVLDVGVHRIKVKSGNSTSVNWIGFTFNA